jgi:hypothetical protein
MQETKKEHGSTGQHKAHTAKKGKMIDITGFKLQAAPNQGPLKLSQQENGGKALANNDPSLGAGGCDAKEVRG